VVLDSEIGQYTTFVRRKGEEWYLGSGTDDTPRALDIPLGFLSDGSENGNGTSEKYVATVYTDGEEVNETFARVPAENEAQISFAFKPSDPGTYEMAVGTAPEEIIDSETVEVTLKTEEFEWLNFEGFEIPEEVARDTTIEVTGTVTNMGEEETLQLVKMTVDDEVVRAKGIDLKAGGSSEVTFEYVFEEPGEYAVEIEDLGPWTVTVPKPGTS